MQRPRLELFLVSFLILFFELAAIRWFGSTVVFLTFFTNIVLLACFLGMSVGLLAASRPGNLMRATLPLTLLAVVLAAGTLSLYSDASERLVIDLGRQESPQIIYFGAEYLRPDPSRWVVPIWVVGGVYFALIALAFAGLGQVMGRAFNAIPDRVAAYSIDVLGSLTGIALFSAMSFLELGPPAWFLVVLPLALYFARGLLQAVSAAAIFVVVVATSITVTPDNRVIWSPYYKINYWPHIGRILTNNIGHQEMLSVEARGPAYLLPYAVVRDAGGAPFDDVLVIGAGSGNDVAAALIAGALRVDAVEIDPRIQRIGSADHPEHPYANKRVTVHIDDGRSFLRRTDRQYDLAIYALVDSLVLHSGYSSLRLENFLFTREAFEDVKKRLKPDGLFFMYNFYRQGWVVGRLEQLATEVFGTPPVVLSLPYRNRIAAEDSQRGSFTLLLAGADSKRLQAVKAKFEKEKWFWASRVPRDNYGLNGFRPKPPADPERWFRIAPAQVHPEGIGPLPSDDWPQLYLRERGIPWAPIGQGMAVIAVLALAILAWLAPVRSVRPDARMFFLGAGFMLLETKGVVHMALLFGSTWLVNSVVFGAILVMILLANLYVLRFHPATLLPYYVLLVAALLLNALVPMSTFLALDPVARTLASCAVVFVPVFFAGVVFAAAFRDSTRPDVDFGSNVAGIILGGLSEQLSLIVGFNQLLLVAAAYYLLSFVLRRRAA